MPSFIIVGYLWQILGRGLFEPVPPFEQPLKSPILNRVKSYKIVMQFFFSKVTAYNLTKKGLHQILFPVKFIKLFRTVFNITNFGKSFCIFQAFMRFYQCFYVTLLWIRRLLFWLLCDWSDVWFHKFLWFLCQQFLFLHS